MTNRQACLDYLARGWVLLAIEPEGKEPIGLAVPNGWHNATRDPAIVEYWLQRWPDMNLAVQPGRSPGLRTRLPAM